MTEQRVRAQRLRAQRLHAGAADGGAAVAAVVREVAAVQAQDVRAAALGVRVRSGGLLVDDVVAAQTVERSIVRTWCMRGTLHLVPAEWLRDLLAIFGHVFIRRGRRRMTELGLDDGTIRRALPRIRELLSGPDPLTRHEIAGALATRGVQIDRAGQAPIHLVRRACLEGIAVEVGTRDGEPVYHLLDGWLPGEPCADRSAALARLARRYLDAHQPAGLGDFAGWSGLPAADVRAGWRAVAGDMTAFDAGGRLWCLGEPPPADGDRDEPTVRLLPAFDGYLLGYADRTHAVDDEHAAAVHPGGGIIRPTLVVDGVCVATWRIDRPRRVGRVVVRPLVALSSTVIGGLSTEVADIGRFLGQSMEVEFEHA